MKKNVLITGIAGAIGSNLARHLIEDEYIVYGIDNFSSAKRENLNGLSNLNFTEGDIRDTNILEKIFRTEFQYVFHLAAFFANQNSIDFPEEDLTTNILGSLNILEHAKKQHSLERIIYASTSCIYASESVRIKENSPLKFETPYALSKYTAEEYLKMYSSHYNLPVSVVRLFNSYGAGEYPGKYRNVIPNFIYNALNDLPITITGTGDETRSFTYVEDTVKGIVASSQYSKSQYIVANIGTEVETKIIELAELIIELTKSKSQLLFQERRSWDKTTSRKPNISIANSSFNFKPEVSLSEGLKKTIDWFIKNNIQKIKYL